MAIDIWEESAEFTPEILAAFDAYPAPSPSKGFEARFWNALETRQSRYRGFSGFLRRLWELEIEGVMVWRLAASMLSGGASGALLLGLSLSKPSDLPAVPQPASQLPITTMRAFAFYKRDWEKDFYLPKARPKSAPPHTPTHAPHQGGDLSWNGSNAHLA
jgi:hypothetical protein